ncbi:MAG: recombinase family protein [Clostridiales bacterium]|nr:recombinase family protein [Clostridiales bacterium]
MRKNENCIAIYSRKSKFTGKGESISNQVEFCREYAHSHFENIPLDQIFVYEDEGFSGGNLHRPDFQKMMEAARKRKFKAIIVYRLDRISRNVSDFSGLIEELSHLDIAFISIKEQFDTSTPMGRAMMYIASVFSQLERETIAERIRDNMHELAKTGRWLGGITPTGYGSEAVKSVSIDGKMKKSCMLKLIPEEAEIVKTIFDLYVETDSQTITEAELMKRGIKTKNNNYFSRFAIKGILQNPVYMIADREAYDYFVKMDADLFSDRKEFDGIHGMMAYNRTSQEKGKVTEYLPPSKWIVSVGRHNGIIPGKVWVKVQESLIRNQTKSYRKPRSNEALLTGCLYCDCGSRMYPKLSQRRLGNGKRVYDYVCKMKERSQGTLCHGKNVNGNRLDLVVMEQIKKLNGNRKTFLNQLGKNPGFYTEKSVDCADHLTALRRNKTETEKKMEGLVDLFIDLEDGALKNHVAKRIELLNQSMMDMELQIGELEGLPSQYVLSGAEFEAMCRFLTVFQDSIDEMTLEQKRGVIRSLVSKVIWDGIDVHIILFGASEE